MAAMGGMTTMAVSEARLPQVPTKAITKGRITGGMFFILSVSRARMRPDSSHMPMASVMVSTRPRGAKPVKFLTMLEINQIKPSLVNRFLAYTGSFFAGLMTETPSRLKMQPRMATITNR